MSVSAPGTIKVPVRVKRAKRTWLARTGKVSVNLALTHTSTGGDPNTRSAKLQPRMD